MKLIQALGKKASGLRLGGTGVPLVQPNIWNTAYLGNGLSWDRETIENDFDAYVRQIMKDDGVVYACMQTRAWVFSQARLCFQRMDDELPGDLFMRDKNKVASHRLDLLNNKKDLLLRMDLDASLAGNAYVTHTDDKGNYGKAARNSSSARLTRLMPHKVDLILWSPSGDPTNLDTRVGAYLYRPNTSPSGQSVILMPSEVAHYAPMPDPEARFRGMSWLQPIVREVLSDKAAEDHKKTFYERGATLGHIVSLSDEVSTDDFEYFLEKFKEEHEGVGNAYKTLFLGGGADVKTIGADLKQLEFSQSQGHGETRIAAASGVPPIIVGLSEGLQAATYANYGQARRRFADGTLRHLWDMACGALENLVDVPTDCRLWFDHREIAFLREDQKDEAEIAEIDARAAKAMIEIGYEPDTVTKWLMTRDPKVLKHTGMVSVQLLPPGSMLNPMAPGQQQGGQPNSGAGQGGQSRPTPKQPSGGKGD